VSDTQNVQLGDYQDAAPISSSVMNGSIMQTVHQSTNMETFSLDKVLHREYLIDTITWSSGSATGASLGQYSFPLQLFNKAFISDKIKDFRFFKGGVRLMVRMTSSKFLYGKIIVQYEPIADGYAIETNVYRMSGYPHFIVSASASEAAVFDVPFVSMYRALNIQSHGDAEIGRFNIRVLNPLTNISGEVSTAQIAVFAQFLEAELFLPVDSLVVESSGGSYAWTGKDYSDSMGSPGLQNNGYMSAKHKGAEGRAKAKTGLISSTLDSTASLAGNLSCLPFVGDSAKMASLVAKGSSRVFKMMGLSKPTSTAATQIMRINPNSDLNYGKGVDLAPKMAMDPENAISTNPIVGGIDADEMNLSFVMQTPRLINIITELPASTPIAIMRMTRYDANVCYVDQIAQLFKYWSGSFKCKVYITASLMHAVRLVFYMGRGVNADWQTCYHRVVDVQGDTEVDMTLPYTAQNALNLADDTYSVYVKILAWSQADSSATTPIYLDVYKAAASDFQVACQLDVGFTPESNPRMDFAQPFQPIHESITGYVCKDMLCGEEFTTIREMIHRYIPYYGVNSASSVVAYDDNLGAGKFGMEMMGLFYRFRRGSIRYRFFQKTAGFGCTNLQIGSTLIPAFSVSNNNIQQLDGEIPYYDDLLFQKTRGSVTDILVFPYSKSNTFFLFKAAGDDFSFHFLQPPPAGVFAQSSGSFGSLGFANFTVA
jgi:hypothetical protein